MNTIFQYDADDRPTADETFKEPWMMIPINKKYSTTGQSTRVGDSKTASQSSEEANPQVYQHNKLFDKRKHILQEAERTQPSEKIKSKLYVLSNSPKRKHKEYESVKLKNPKISQVNKDENHYHLHLYQPLLYHHMCTKNRKNETEASKTSSKVSGVTAKNIAHTDTDIKYTNVEKSRELKDDSKERNPTISDEDLYDEDVLETIVNLGYPIEEVIRLIENEDEEMISLYLSLLKENQNQLKAIYPSYMRSKVSDWKNYAFLLASPENSSSRSRKEKSRNNRVLSYSPKRNKHYMKQSKGSMSGSGGDKQLRFAFYPKEVSPDENSSSRTRKQLAN